MQWPGGCHSMMLSRKPNLKMSHTVWFLLYNILEATKVSRWKTDRWVVTRSWEWWWERDGCPCKGVARGRNRDLYIKDKLAHSDLPVKAFQRLAMTLQVETKFHNMTCSARPSLAWFLLLSPASYKTSLSFPLRSRYCPCFTASYMSCFLPPHVASKHTVSL